MFDAIFLTYGPFVVCLVMLALGIYERRATRRWRQLRNAIHAAQLVAIAYRADELALLGRANPGTTAAREVDPNLDLTLGGQLPDNHPAGQPDPIPTPSDDVEERS